MKAGTHPVYTEATISCACGNVINTRATKPVIKVEICSACHPYYTGKFKFIDTAGRIERFMNKYAKKKKLADKKASKH